jgi:hypothetical protein
VVLSIFSTGSRTWPRSESWSSAPTGRAGRRRRGPGAPGGMDAPWTTTQVKMCSGRDQDARSSTGDAGCDARPAPPSGGLIKGCVTLSDPRDRVRGRTSSAVRLRRKGSEHVEASACCPTSRLPSCGHTRAYLPLLHRPWTRVRDVIDPRRSWVPCFNGLASGQAPSSRRLGVANRSQETRQSFLRRQSMAQCGMSKRD